MTEEAIQEARGKIVQALNLTPLVPPQSDVETDNVVNDAWSGLHDLVMVARRVAELEQELERRTIRTREARVARLEAALEWLRFAAGWEAFKPVRGTNEWRDFTARIDSALAGDGGGA